MKIHYPNITGSAIALNGFTGSLQGTSSWATAAVTASFALNTPIAETYSIYCGMAGTTLGANTTYYMGQGGYVASTVANRRNVYIPFTGALVGATIITGTTTVTVTAADVAVNFRLNDTTDTSLGNVRFTGGNANSNGNALSYNVTGLNVSVTAGNFFEIKFTTPFSYASPPSAASLNVMLYFTRTS